MFDKPSVALGKRDELLRLVTALLYARAKIEQARPCGRLLELQSVIVATCVIAIPGQTIRCKTVLPKPVRKRNSVERGNLAIIRTIPDRHDKRAAAARIPPIHPTIDLLL